MPTEYGGYMGRVAKIDLTGREISDYAWTDEDRIKYLGGKIMAAKIIYDHIKEPIDPLSPDNLLVVTTGPLTGSGAPCSSRFNISTLSPLTGVIASSNCGGSFGIHLKKAGYDAVIITGKADKPIWIDIGNDRIDFKDASDLWGKSTGETQEFLGDKTGKIVIGPAGENLVKYACVLSEQRVAGRAGAGAVIGSKNIKAVVAGGNQRVMVKDPSSFKETSKNWIKLLRQHPLTGVQLPRLGTAGILSLMNIRGVLPTRNFSRGRFKDFELISGEYLAEKYLARNKGCVSCPIQCGRVVEYKGKQIKGPELETLGLLGSNIENADLGLIIEWNYLLDELGLDTISTGGTIAFAMELQEKGLWNSGLRFGETKGLAGIFEDIAYRRGIGNILAEGSRWLSQKYGGEKFSMHVKGLELAAYNPRNAVGQGLGYAVSNRGGCHLNAGYLMILEGLVLAMDPHTAKSKAALAVMTQNVMEAVSAAGSCLFTTYTVFGKALMKNPNGFLTRLANRLLTYSGPFVGLINNIPGKLLPFDLPILPHTKAVSNITGMKLHFGTFKEIGERGYNLERLFNNRMGITEKDDALPARFTEEYENSDGPKAKVPLQILKNEYYRIRGWDKNGVPKVRTQDRLSID